MSPEDHDLYSMYGKSFLNVTLSNFIQFKEFILCDGINVRHCSKQLICQKHILQKIFNYVDYQLLQFKPHLCQDEYYRWNNCKILIKPSFDKKSCLHCHSLNQKII